MDNNILSSNNNIIPSPLNHISEEKTEPKYAVGIDFGTSGIGYAYGSFQKQDNIFLSNFSGQANARKVPTEIILDTNLKDVLAFGRDCKGYIARYDNENYEYFKNIKMNLYNKNYKIKSTNGREADIELIITKILIEVSNKAIEQIRIKQNDLSITKEDIRWVVTIPAIWEEKSKQIMINSSKSAGLIDKDTDLSLFLALEPEVAGIYYNSPNSPSSFNENGINDGKPYIICDVGGGTVDICTHRSINITENKRELIEEYPPLGGDYGGNKINEEFIKRLIIEIFGEKKINAIKNDKSNEDWDKFEEEIENLKKDFSLFEPKDMKLDCSLFIEDDSDKTLEDYIKEYSKKNLKYKYDIKQIKNKKYKWELLIPSKVFSDITKEISEKIFSKIEEIYKNVHTGYVLFTGAGSQNYNITHYLYEFAKKKNINLYITTPEHPEVSVVHGAVLFGFNSHFIRKRKARYTIGIKVCRKWDETLHKDKGVKRLLKDEYHCTNLFCKFITINEYILFDQVKSEYCNAYDPNPTIIFYKTLKEDCTFVDEKNENNELIIKKFGEFQFDIGKDYDKNNNKIRIDIKYGGTYIYATAIYLKTKKSIPIFQSFV